LKYRTLKTAIKSGETVRRRLYGVLIEAKKVLKENGLPDADSSAEFLLSAVLKTKRSQLPLMRERELTAQELKFFKDFISRRAKREPVAYITGLCEFMGFEFIVDKNVLIPRPETELLVEEVLSNYPARKKIAASVLDLCCGSGCIAASLAKLGNFKITASDASGVALNIAKQNAKINGVSDINFIESDMFENISGKFDAIISNPPYISDGEYKSLEPELFFEPKNALTDEKDGLSFYRIIAENAKKYLNPGGKIFLELNANKSEQIKEIFATASFSDIKIIKDYARLDRILTATKRQRTDSK